MRCVVIGDRSRVHAPSLAARLMLVALVAAAPAGAQSVRRVTGNARVDGLLAQMTLEEKIAMIHGEPEDSATTRGQAGLLPGIPRLHIPPLRFTDGPPGVSTRDPSTGMPATMALAATFSRADARKNGMVIARDARALGQDVVLEPFINIVRDFGFGRAYNMFGEDPFLTGEVGAAMITGVQSQGIMAQAKHLIAYEGGNDVVVDPQTLHEIYLAPFAAAIRAGVSSIMCSYNRINGPYACGSGEVQNRIVRHELGFNGFITSDWGGTHGTLFINEGLELEMPGARPNTGGEFGGRGTYFMARTGSSAPLGIAAQAGGTGPGGRAPAAGGQAFAGFIAGAGVPPEERAMGAATRRPGGGPGRRTGDPAPIGMLTALANGQVTEETITAAVGRILFQMNALGFLDRAPKHTVTSEDHDYNAPIIRKTAEDAAVLLKNDDGMLPLAASELSSVAFIGPGAEQTIAIGMPGEKSLGLPERQVGPVAAIERIAGHPVTLAVANDMTGRPIPASAFTHGGAAGLVRSGATGATQVDAQIDFTARNHAALPERSSVSWTGELAVPTDGSYTIALQLLGGGGSVTIDSQPVINVAMRGRNGNSPQPVQDNVLPTTDNLDNARATLPLRAGGHTISVKVTSFEAGQPVQVRLAWVTPDQQQANYAAAIAAAKRAKKVVVFAWGRGRPDPFGLPGDQNQLIDDVISANPNTIVVLNTSLPVAMPWAGRVKAIVQMWWPGDEGGPATADILLGRANPAGRLPITWPVAISQMVAEDSVKHPERTDAGVAGKTTYSEGIYVGYRWFDHQGLDPLFPFGYGLSYTRFQYAGLGLAKTSGGGMTVSFTVRNAGTRAGDEVPQVYVGPPSAGPSTAEFAVRSLVAFDRITLAPGETRRVTLRVPARQLAFWSTPDGAWRMPPGSRTVFVGRSSRDTPLHANLTFGSRR